MTASEASLAIPVVIYLPLAGLIALTLAWHALVAPRLTRWRRERSGSLARLRALQIDHLAQRDRSR